MHKAVVLLLAAVATANAQQKPTPETASWWAQTTALSNDSMEGRDTGTEAYERAAKYVAAQFAAAGLKPAGDNGTFFQRVPMHQTDLDMAHSSIEVGYAEGPAVLTPLTLLQETTLVPRPGMNYQHNLEMVFVGYGVPSVHDLALLKNRVAVFFNNTPAGLSTVEQTAFASRRLRTLTDAGAAAIVSIDNPAATEPTHWPAAYARSVQILPTQPASAAPLVIRISAEAAPKLFKVAGKHRGHLSPQGPLPDITFVDLLRDGEHGAPLPSLLLNATLHIRLATTEKGISSPNVLAVLPGSDPKLAPEYVGLSAHLDGYGYGTPVLDDSLYNGTLDDAAYVALLIEVAKNLHTKAPARSLLFCVFTGEEKGLLGSAWFTQHPTVPVTKIVADLNLDQLRPIFPLNILTMEGIADSTLGATVKTLADSFHIELRPDREPERNLYRRADNYNFVRIGVPIASFIFGYNPGSPEEAIYRDWYARRYHKPQDDLATPIDWAAAATFNRFYQQLAVIIANNPSRPEWLAIGPNAPKALN